MLCRFHSNSNSANCPERANEKLVYVSPQSSLDYPYLFAMLEQTIQDRTVCHCIDIINILSSTTMTFQEKTFSFWQNSKKKSMEYGLGIEKTILKDVKADAGIIGFTREKTDAIRWTLTHHLTGWRVMKHFSQCPSSMPFFQESRYLR